MKKNIFIFFIIIIVLTGLIHFFILHNRSASSTVNLRESYLNQLNNLSNVHIDSEITIDNYIICGYTSSNNNYGLAIFEPLTKNNYKFQSNINSIDNEIIITTILINNVYYDLFWANKSDLDFAKIIYYTSSGRKEYKLDASNNKILFLKAPTENYDVYPIFFDTSGVCYR